MIDISKLPRFEPEIRGVPYDDIGRDEIHEAPDPQGSFVRFCDLEELVAAAASEATGGIHTTPAKAEGEDHLRVLALCRLVSTLTRQGAVSARLLRENLAVIEEGIR